MKTDIKEKKTHKKSKISENNLFKLYKISINMKKCVEMSILCLKVT